MALTAANPGGWSLNEVLTSAQMNHLQNELLKAVDGVNGGLYTLGSTLSFDGADVRFLGNLVIPSGADIEVENGGDVNLASGADINLNSGAAIEISLGALIAVAGLVDVQTGGEARISSGGILNVNSGGRMDLNNGSEAHLEGTATFDVEGTGGLNVVSGGRLRIRSSGDMIVEGGGDVIFQTGGGGGQAIFQSGAFATFLAGSGIFIDHMEDIGIDDANENWRSSMRPLFQPAASVWDLNDGGELTWEQQTVAAAVGLYFPIPVAPGDDLVNVYVGLNPESGHTNLPSVGGVMPRVRILRANLDGSTTELATRSDPSLSIGAYEAFHYIQIDAANIDTGSMPILATFDPLYLHVQGESGPNGVVGLEICSITGNSTVRRYRSSQAFYS